MFLFFFFLGGGRSGWEMGGFGWVRKLCEVVALFVEGLGGKVSFEEDA